VTGKEFKFSVVELHTPIPRHLNSMWPKYEFLIQISTKYLLLKRLSCDIILITSLVNQFFLTILGFKPITAESNTIYTDRGRNTMLRIYISTFIDRNNRNIYWSNPRRTRINPSSKYIFSLSQTSMTIVNFIVPTDAGVYNIRLPLLHQRKEKSYFTSIKVEAKGKFILTFLFPYTL